MTAKVLALASMALLLVGCATTTNQGIAPDVAPDTASDTASAPRPSAEVNIRRQSAALQPVVQAPVPVRIQIPSVSIDIEIVPVGVEANGFMEIPENVTIAGWYRYGPAPSSDKGSTVITAHVDALVQGLGPFAALSSLPENAEIIVTTEAGEQHRYILESVQNFEKEQLPLDQVFDRSGAPRLVLVTCGGQFDKKSRTYSDNVIAIANPM
jgi:sortase (surface protein transpeptidase)